MPSRRQKLMQKQQDVQDVMDDVLPRMKQFEDKMTRAMKNGDAFSMEFLKIPERG